MNQDDFEPTYAWPDRPEELETAEREFAFRPRQDDSLNAARGIVIAAALSLAVWCLGAMLVIVVAAGS